MAETSTFVILFLLLFLAIADLGSAGYEFPNQRRIRRAVPSTVAPSATIHQSSTISSATIRTNGSITKMMAASNRANLTRWSCKDKKPKSLRICRRLNHRNIVVRLSSLEYFLLGLLITQTVIAIVWVVAVSISIKRKIKKLEETKANKEEKKKKKTLLKGNKKPKPAKKSENPQKSAVKAVNNAPAAAAGKDTKPAGKDTKPAQETTPPSSWSEEKKLPNEIDLVDDKPLEEKYSLEECPSPLESLKNLIKRRELLASNFDPNFLRDYRKGGNVHIPRVLSIPAPQNEPTEKITLDNVEYDPTKNELFEVGSQVDSYDAPEPTTPGTLTGEESTNKRTPLTDATALQAVGVTKSNLIVPLTKKSAEQKSFNKDEMQI